MVRAIVDEYFIGAKRIYDFVELRDDVVGWYRIHQSILAEKQYCALCSQAIAYCIELGEPCFLVLVRGDAADGADYDGYICALLFLMKEVATTAENFVIGMGSDYKYSFPLLCHRDSN